MPKSSWQEEPLSFALITGWILSFALTFVVFVNNYLPTGLSLIEGIYGKKLAIAIPVLIIMGIVFFIMTALIIGGIFIVALLGLFFGCGALLNFLLILLGGTGNLFEVIKATLFCSGVVLAGLINIFLMIAVKYKMMSASVWIAGENVIFYLICVFLFGLLAILGRKIHRVAKWRAFLAATVPFILFVLFNYILSAKILPKLIGILG